MARTPNTADVFTAVADPVRREILDLVAAEERPVNEIVVALRLDQPAVSKHLKVLHAVGLVTVRKDGRRRLYRTQAERLRPVHEWAAEFARFWDHQLDQIKARAEAAASATTSTPSPGADP